MPTPPLRSIGNGPRRAGAVLRLGLLFLSACTDDAPPSGPRPSEPRFQTAGATCQAECALVTDAMPFASAVFRRDSAESRVYLGTALVQGARGDGVTLTLAADKALFAARTDAKRVIVEVDEVARAYTLDEVAGGVSVWSFEAPGTVRVRYWLNRQMRSVVPPSARVRLTQRVL